MTAFSTVLHSQMNREAQITTSEVQYESSELITKLAVRSLMFSPSASNIVYYPESMVAVATFDILVRGLGNNYGRHMVSVPMTVSVNGNDVTVKPLDESHAEIEHNILTLLCDCLVKSNYLNVIDWGVDAATMHSLVRRAVVAALVGNAAYAMKNFIRNSAHRASIPVYIEGKRSNNVYTYTLALTENYMGKALAYNRVNSDNKKITEMPPVSSFLKSWSYVGKNQCS